MAGGAIGLAEIVAMWFFSNRGAGRFTLFSADPVVLGFLATVVTYSIVGALIAFQRPSSRVAWVMLAIGVGLGTAVTTFGYGIVGVDPAFGWPAASWFLVFSQILFLPSIGLFATSLLLVFPDDRFVSPRWRLALAVSIAGSLLFIAGSIFRPGPLPTDLPPEVYSPLAAPVAMSGALATAVDVGNALSIVGILLGAISLVVRYRRSDRVQAAQIRWLALVGLVAAIGLGYGALQAGPLSDIAFTTGILALAAMPVAVWIAITRYRLYDIDRLINRAIVYGSLTAILAGVFTAAVGLAQRVFIALTDEQSDAAIVATTLIVATLYAPLRKRLDAVVDRRFKYEHARFGAYREELARVLSTADPHRAAERLIGEAVGELGVVGGAVLDAAGRPVATAGLWPVEVETTIPIAGGGQVLRSLALGRRADGRALDARGVLQLGELATLAAAAARDVPAATRA